MVTVLIAIVVWVATVEYSRRLFRRMRKQLENDHQTSLKKLRDALTEAHQSDIGTLKAEHRDRDECLDYLLTEYHLNVHDPYIVSPMFSERRCFHCGHPEGCAHRDDCIWLNTYYMVKRLYPIKPARMPQETTETITDTTSPDASQTPPSGAGGVLGLS